MCGQPIDRIFTPEDRAVGAPERETETARTCGYAADERWHLRKDGSCFFADGAGFVKAMRELLTSAREKLELAVAGTQLGQFDFWPASKLLEWDDRRRELFGQPPAAGLV